MASTPSASALSAVLRCRGNLIARNQAVKKRPSTAYSLGLTYEAMNESVPQSTLARDSSLLGSLFRGERVGFLNLMTIAIRLASVSSRGQGQRNDQPTSETRRICDSTSAGSQLKGIENLEEGRTAVRRRASTLRPWSSNCPKHDRITGNNFKLRNVTKFWNCDKTFWSQSAGSSKYLCVSLSYAPTPRSVGKTNIHLLILSSWSALKDRVLFWTGFVSEIVRSQRGIERRSSLLQDVGPENRCCRYQSDQGKHEDTQNATGGRSARPDP